MKTAKAKLFSASQTVIYIDISVEMIKITLMRKSQKELQKFERELLKRQPVNVIQNFKIFEALYKEAMALGILPSKNPLEGIEVDIKIAKVVNSV